MKVTKEFSFCAAHILSDYDGKCSNLHGHNYRLKITLEGDIIQNKTSNERGMVMDFGTLKHGVSEIIDKWDHAFIIDNDSYDQMQLAIYLEKNNLCTRFKHMKGRTTAENMIKDIVGDVVKQLIQDNINNVKTIYGKLWETPTSCVSYKKDVFEDSLTMGGKE